MTASRFLALALVCAVAVAGCSAGATAVSPNPTNPPWFDVAMTDVNSNREFRISDFAGKVVLVDAMATWCPACQREMDEIKDVIAALGPDGDLVVVSLDVDSSEDAALLAKFAELHDFDWRVAVGPQEVLRFLATNYDVQYLNPPLQPMLVIDRKGGVWGLPFGFKSSASLKSTIEQYLAGKS